MDGIEDNKIFFKLDASESVEYKREILEIVESLIKAEIASKKFSELRAREKKIISRIKNDLKSIHKDMRKVTEELPHKIHHREKEEYPEADVAKKEINAYKSNKKKDNGKNMSDSERYMKELEDIREKIARLS